MTKLRTYLSIKLTVLALLVGRVVLGAFAVAVVVMVLGLVGSAWGGQGTAPAPTPAPSPSPTTPVVDTSGMAQLPRPAAAGPVLLSPATAPVVGPAQLADGPVRSVLVALHSTEVSAALWNDLLDAGWNGDPDDGTDDVIYAPVNLVIFDEIGTWTITLDGPARCEHGSARPCSGAEWVR